MARLDPILPNAAIVARREYRDRVRSRLYLASTLILMTLALGVALTPIAIRYLDSRTVTQLAIVSADAALAERAVGVVDAMLNNPPQGVDAATWQKPFRFAVVGDPAEAEAGLSDGAYAGVIRVDRQEDGRLHVTFRTPGIADATRAQLVGFAAIGLAVLDWTANLPDDAQLDPFQAPQFDLESATAPTSNGRPVSQQEVASRGFVGTVFIVLMFLSILIYGMWVATGVAAEKSSRVMELMISAASPRQLVIGKVLGIGGAGLTQYVAIALPGAARARIPGPDRFGGARAGGGFRNADHGSHGRSPPGLWHVLPARLRAVRLRLRRGRLVREPPGRPADAVAAIEPARDGGIPRCLADPADRRRGPDRAADVDPAAVQPVRDARAPDGRPGPAMGGGAVTWPARPRDRGRGRGGDPHLFRGRAAVRAAPGPARVRGSGDAPVGDAVLPRVIESAQPCTPGCPDCSLGHSARSFMGF